MAKLKYIGKIMLSGLLALLLLSPVAVLYDFKGISVTCLDGSTIEKDLPYNLIVNGVEGYGINRADYNGYINADNTPISEKPVDILLMGSSHVEGLHVMQKENIAEFMNTLIPDMRTYNIGVSGHVFTECINNLPDAIKTYDPTAYVVIETDTVIFSKDSMQAAAENENIIIEKSPLGVEIKKNINRVCPSVRAISSGIHDMIETSLQGEDSDKVYLDGSYISALDKMLRFAAGCMKDECVLIVLYHPRSVIDENGALVKDPVEQSFRDIFANICEENGIFFADMTDAFSEMYTQKRLLAHGFLNTKVGSGHLNRYGNETIASVLTEIINRENIR